MDTPPLISSSPLTKARRCSLYLREDQYGRYLAIPVRQDDARQMCLLYLLAHHHIGDDYLVSITHTPVGIEIIYRESLDYYDVAPTRVLIRWGDYAVFSNLEVLAVPRAEFNADWRDPSDD